MRVLGSLLWHTRAGKGNRAEFSVIGAEPAHRLVQDKSIRVGEAEVAFPAGSCDDTFGQGNAAERPRTSPLSPELPPEGIEHERHP